MTAIQDYKCRPELEPLTEVFLYGGQQHQSYISVHGDVAIIPALWSYLTPTPLHLCPKQAVIFTICHCCHAHKYQSHPAASSRSPAFQPMAAQLSGYSLQIDLLLI